jgi:hypothetical protein
VVERALAVVEDTRKIKSQLTGAKTSIDGARTVLEDMEARVKAYLSEIADLATAGEGVAGAPAGADAGTGAEASPGAEAEASASTAAGEGGVEPADPAQTSLV